MRGFPLLSAFFLLFVAVLAGGPADAQTGPQPRLRTTPLVLTTVTGQHRFTVEMALTDEQRAIGLMFRENVPADEGMLFDFGRDDVVAMWMRNTIVSLDMVFIRADGTVAHVAERTTPQSLDIVSSRTPVRAVLELAAGTARRIGLRPGDRARNVIFGNGP
jgi:uncharacterized protein